MKQDYSQPTKMIQNIKVGEVDYLGNKIKYVYVTQNEFSIYEIENNDINNQLRILIDGYTQDRESILLQKFNKVKVNYTKAKGLLYRSSNFGMMKNRVAHLLATVLSSNDEEFDGNGEFEKLINEIKEEYNRSIRHRLLYLLPSMIVSFIVGIFLFINYPDWYQKKQELWKVLCIIFGSSIGGTMSIIFRIGKNNFEEHLSSLYYFLTGFERIILSIFAGIIAYVGIESGILFGNIDNKSYWTIMAVAILAGFSEALIPGLLSKISNDIKEKL